MQLREIKDIYLGDHLYESLMAGDELLDEGAKELFNAGMQKMGQAAEKLKDAVDAPAQKAWAEVQSRLATAGKDDAIGKLKDFASKNKVAIGTLAIIGMGLLTATDASAGDSMYQAAGGDNLMGALFQGAIDNGADRQVVGDALSNLEVNGMSAQEFAKGAEEAASQADNYVQRNQILADAGERMKKALLGGVDGGNTGSGEQVAQNTSDDIFTTNSQQAADGSSTSSRNNIFGKKQTVNWGKGVGNAAKSAANSFRNK